MRNGVEVGMFKGLVGTGSLRWIADEQLLKQRPTKECSKFVQCGVITSHG